MRTTHICLTVAAVAALVFAVNASAQTNPTGLLNAVELRTLVTRAEPSDHARLTTHFGTLAEQYAAEARRHTSMAQSFAGNPSRTLGTGMSTHCKRLADLNTQLATTVRELVTYHDKLSSGSPATPPAGGARFEGGAGAPEPTEKELNALASRASTPADHRALEEYFLTTAKRYSAEANEHVAMAQAYRGTRITQAAVHCDHLVAILRDSAKEATAAAAGHKELANTAR
jgi:hypothetical protein